MTDKTTSKTIALALAAMLVAGAGQPLDYLVGSPTFIIPPAYKATLTDRHGHKQAALVYGFDECPERRVYRGADAGRCVVIRQDDTSVRVQVVDRLESRIEEWNVRRIPSRPGFVALERPDQSFVMTTELSDIWGK